MRIDILTLFPEMFDSVLKSSILKRASEEPVTPKEQSQCRSAAVSYHLTNIRDFTTNKHAKVDQRPFGGGPGMVMQCQPIWDAVQFLEREDLTPATRVVMTPQGRKLDQSLVDELATKPRLLIIAGHYEGIDERVIEKLEPVIEISIGDYVLTGGELPAMVLIDAVVRLVPGVLGDAESASVESFSKANHGRLDCPHYTRPRIWEGMSVPGVLLSGDHAKVESWRQEQSDRRTAKRRPDLMRIQN